MRGYRGCKRTPKSFDLSTIRAKSVKFWAKSMKLLTKYLKFWGNCLKIRIKMKANVVCFEKLAPNVGRIT